MGKKEKGVLILSLLLVVLMISSYVYSLVNRLDDIVFFDHEITLYEQGINYQRIYYITDAGDTRKVIGLSFNDDINLRARGYGNEEVRNFGLYDLHIAYLEVFIPQTYEEDVLLENPSIQLSNGDVINKDIGHFYLVSRKQNEEDSHYRGESSSDGNFDFFRYYEAKEYRFDTAYLSEEHYDDWLVAYEVFDKYDDLLYPSDFVSLNEFEGPIKVDKWFAIGTKHLSKDVVYSTGMFFQEVNGLLNKGIYLHLNELPLVDYGVIKKVIKEKQQTRSEK